MGSTRAKTSPAKSLLSLWKTSGFAAATRQAASELTAAGPVNAGGAESDCLCELFKVFRAEDRKHGG